MEAVAVPELRLLRWVPNKNYSGPDKPILSKVIWTPFTTDTAEMDTLRSGTTLDIGGVPLNDIRQIPALKAEGYSVAQVPSAGVAEILPNLYNPTAGPLLRLAVHQAGDGVPDQPPADRHEGLRGLRRPRQRARAGAVRQAVGLAAGEGGRPVPVLAAEGDRAAEGARLEGRAGRHRHLRAARHRAPRTAAPASRRASR